MSGDFSGRGRGGNGGGLADVRAEELEKDSLCRTRTKAHFSANVRRWIPVLRRKVLQLQTNTTPSRTWPPRTSSSPPVIRGYRKPSSPSVIRGCYQGELLRVGTPLYWTDACKNSKVFPFQHQEPETWDHCPRLPRTA